MKLAVSNPLLKGLSYCAQYIKLLLHPIERNHQFCPLSSTFVCYASFWSSVQHCEAS